MLDDDVIEEDDLCDLHGDVILVGSRLQVAHHARPNKNIGSVDRVEDPDPDWIRIQSGQWIRIRIEEGKNDPQK